MTGSASVSEHEKFLQRALDLAEKNVARGCGPFGAIVVKNGQVIAEASNQVTDLNDPTAHAEVQAIRAACAKLKNFQLDDCIIYSSCEPCPMCLSALYWSRPKAVYFAATRQEAAAAGFDDEFIYQQIPLPHAQRQLPVQHVKLSTALGPFKAWEALPQKISY